MPDPVELAHRPILAGLPGDETTPQVAETAYELARLLQSPLEFWHGVPHGSLLAAGFRGDRLVEQDAERCRRAREHLTRVLDGVPGAPASLDDMLNVVAGHAARGLVERAVELDAGLLLLGPHRRRGVFDLGSTARALLTHAPCPVWAQVGDWRPIERVLLPTDMSEDSVHAGRVARRLAHHVGAKLHVVHAFLTTPDPYPPVGGPVRADMPAPPKGLTERLREETRARFESFMADLQGEEVLRTHEFVDEEPVAAVLGRQRPGDLVVMATQGRGKLSSAVVGSVTYGVLRGAEGPVLAVPHVEDRGQRARLAVDSFHVTA